ncbi:polysaccharide pyruvyl transferase family protein [Devosia sp. ZW T5_3]|uniref:polysaccharide pyruvyl transferase family protein n=1 Tax=Devosia sp. ZW T5_3 TaxID=3378085 RepID=UPI0038528ECE
MTSISLSRLMNMGQSRDGGIGTPTAFAGTDHTDTMAVSENLSAASKEFLDLFDYVSLRSMESVEWARSDGVDAHYGADWAFNLQSDTDPSVKKDHQRAAVVFREFPKGMLDTKLYLEDCSRLLEGLRAQNYCPVLLPFAPEDEHFANELGLSRMAPQEVHWWNARRIQQIIASSGLLVSVGRLHPMIFAANVGTPSVQVAPPVRPGVDPKHLEELRIMGGELNVPYVASVQEVLDFTASPVLEDTASPVAASRERLSNMIEDLHGLFGAGQTFARH